MTKKHHLSSKKSANSSTNYKKIIVALIVLALFIGVVGFGAKKYQDYETNKVYSLGQAMKFSDFTITVEKSKLKPVDLPLNKEVLAKYGALGTKENCEAMSRDPIPSLIPASILSRLDTYVVPNPSPYNMCYRRIDARKEVEKYTTENKQLNLDFTIKAKGTVATKNLRIEVLPDSGRKINKNVDNLKGNELLYENESTGERNGSYYPDYTPYYMSDLGGNINPALSRSGYVYGDIRNSEKSVDFVVKYGNKAKITRIQL